MAPNPNPARISEPMWWFAEQCFAMFGWPSNKENGGLWFRKPGYHADRDWLIAQRKSNDYSVRNARNKRGPGDKGAAFDWTFPDAQAGDYTSIRKVMDRIETAWHTRDPRMYGVAEVLGQADFDKFAEGFVFYPSRSTRTPDSSHLWHIHFSFIREFLEDWAAFQALFSVVAGETLTQWQRAKDRPAQEPARPIGDQMLMLVRKKGAPADEVWLTDLMTRRLLDAEELADVRVQMKPPGHWAPVSWQHGTTIAEVDNLDSFGVVVGGGVEE